MRCFPVKILQVITLLNDPAEASTINDKTHDGYTALHFAAVVENTE